MMAEPIPDNLDTSNDWAVRTSPQGLIVVDSGWPPMYLTPDQALVLAAWLVAVADPEGHRFNQILARVLEKH